MGRLSVGDLHTHRRSTAPTATPAQKQLSTFPPSAAVKWRLLIGGEGVVLDEEEHRFSLEITGTKKPKVRNHCRHCSSCCTCRTQPVSAAPTDRRQLCALKHRQDKAHTIATEHNRVLARCRTIGIRLS